MYLIYAGYLAPFYVILGIEYVWTQFKHPHLNAVAGAFGSFVASPALILLVGLEPMIGVSREDRRRIKQAIKRGQIKRAHAVGIGIGEESAALPW